MQKKIQPFELNKVNYSKPPNQLSKLNHEDGSAVGKWQIFQTNDNNLFDPDKPYFVVLRQGEGVIDFDIITKEKLLNDKKGRYAELSEKTRQQIMSDEEFTEPIYVVQTWLAKWGIPSNSYIVKSGTGGIHYYVKYNKKYNLHNTSGLMFVENLAIDFRGPGGLIYGEGTCWKDTNPYTKIAGDPEKILSVDAHRIAGVIGMFEQYIGIIHLGGFMLGLVNPHDPSLNIKHEFLYWRESMFLLKEIGYGMSEILSVFSKIPGYDQTKSEQQIRAYWDKENDPRRIRPKRKPQQFLDTEPKKELSVDEQSDLISILPEFSRSIGSNKTVYKNKTSIFVVTKKANGEVREDICQFKEFEITGKYNENKDYTPEDFCNIRLNGKDYFNLTHKDLLKMIHDLTACSNSGIRNINPILEEMIDKAPDVSGRLRYGMGFFDEGWVLPNEYYFKFKEGSAIQLYGQIKRLSELPVNYEKAKKIFNTLYDAFTCYNKDLMFCYYFAAPFLHCIKQRTKIKPALCLGGENQKGKSESHEVGIGIIWGLNLVKGGDFIRSPSRLFGAMACSTFPINIDDSENFPDYLVDNLKSDMSGVNVPFTRKMTDQSFSVNEIILSSLCTTFNDYPNFMKSKAMRDRIIVILYELFEYNFNWSKIVPSLDKGFIGRVIIDYTKNWNYMNVMERINNYKDFWKSTFSDLRSIDIAAVFSFGASLIEELFHKKMDLSPLPRLIRQSKSTGMDELISGIRHMALSGVDIGNGSNPKDWVRQSTVCTRIQGTWGIIIDTQRKNELYGQYKDNNVAKATRISSVCAEIQIVWDKCFLKNFHVSEKTEIYGIFVPCEYLIGKNMNIYEYCNIPSDQRENLLKEEKENEPDFFKLLEEGIKNG